MSTETVIAVLTALGASQILRAIVDELLRGRRDARRARGLTPDARLEAAFWAEQCALVRERALAAGMSLDEIGPRPVWVPPADDPRP